MIAGSLLLILAAVVLLVLGLANGSNPMLVSSIAASLLAAIALVVGARQAAAARVAGDDYLDEVDGERDAGEADQARAPARERVAAGVPGQPPGDQVATEDGRRLRQTGMPDVPEQRPAEATGMAPGDGVGGRPEPGVPSQPPMSAAARPEDGIGDDEDPADEPPPQEVDPADTARLTRMSTEVLVIDGRPRYHLASCVHLLGREGEPLPVSEAIELGFSPCGLCEPASALLADTRR